ncbi:MAG: hypothetical protein QOG31_1814 [Thermoplasmata archaeon]|jgi:uncharacterized protein YecE (DUF72 family)|nr:hypothetical protein [Thermoplasmata archaeon]
MRIRFGLAAWSNSHFDNALYPLRTPHAEYLPRYATLFDVAEADVLSHRMPGKELREWVEQTPKGFEFLPKMHESVTHEGAGAAKAKAFLEGLAPLRDAKKLGPVLLQFPASLDRLKGAELLQELLRLDDPGAFAVEVRSSSWFTDAFRSLLEDHEAILVWGTFPKAFAPPWATAAKGYLRFTGKHIHKRGRHVTVEDRLADVMEMRKRVEQASWKEAYCIVTNPFEGNAVDSLPRIAAALAGPEEGKRHAHKPGEVLFKDPPGGKGGTQTTL